MTATSETFGAKAGPRGNGHDADGLPLPVEMFDEIDAPTDSADFVERLLCSGAFSLLYGESGCGKTHMAVDLAYHVAVGRNWFGRQVDQAGVVYIAAEGGSGIKKRIAALRRHFMLNGQPVPIAVVTRALDLRLTHGDLMALELTILGLRDRLPGGIGLVIIDTLSRCLGGGDENSPEDMGRFVQALDRLRAATGAHILVIHHSGKDASRGARGHSLLRAAVDTEIEVTRDATSQIASAKVRKQRDLDCEGEFVFTLQTIEIGTDRRGKPITSCVVRPLDGGKPAPKQKITGAAKIAYDRLCKALDEHGEIPPYSLHIPQGWRAVRVEHWRRIYYAGTASEDGTPEANKEAKKKAFRRAMDSLREKGAIQIHDDWVWSTSRGQGRGTEDNP